MMRSYDLIVIGGGPGGYTSACEGAKGGLQTLLIEKENIGGVCLNEGCVPTKTLLHCAKIYEHAKDGKSFGVSGEVFLDHKAVLKRKERVIKLLKAGIASKLKQNSVEVVSGEGKIARKEGDAFIVEANGEEYSAKNVIIASGSSSAVIPVEGVMEGLKSGFVITSKEALLMEDIPESMCVVGGGVIGLEMASYYGAAGAKVYIIELLDKIGGPIDGEVSALLKKEMEKKGIKFYLGAALLRVTKDSIVFSKDGAEEEIKCEKVLLCVGRRPNIAGLGLENLGVTTEKGAIKTDEKMMTNIAGIYAVGDVNGKMMLAHTAYKEAETAIGAILGKQVTINYFTIPSAIYTSPEVSCVGETLEGAVLRGINAKKTTLTMRSSGRYIAETDSGGGFVSVVYEEKTGDVLGVHMIGSYASELIFGAAMIVELGLKKEDVEKVVFPHPTVSEVLREAILQIEPYEGE